MSKRVEDGPKSEERRCWGQTCSLSQE